MKHQKYTYRLLVVMLVVVAFSLVSVVSPARAETLSATDQSVVPTDAATDQAAADGNLRSLAAQAAATGIGVRTVNGVKVFHTRDGRDLEMVKICDGSDGVRYYGETLTLESAFAWELHPHTGIELPGDLKLPGDSNQRTMSALPIAALNPVTCYAQNDSRWGGLPLGWGRINRPTIGAEGCIVTSAAMEAATYGLSVYYSDVTNPGTMNAWLVQRSGFSWNTTDGAYTDIIFERMSLLSGIGGTWQSWQNFTSIALVYSCARSFIVGSSSVKPSLPIVKMEKYVGTTHYVHYCAWYGSDGTQTAASNLIIQPTLTNYSNESLKCTFVCGVGNKYYSPVTTTDLMRVAWKN